MGMHMQSLSTSGASQIDKSTLNDKQILFHLKNSATLRPEFGVLNPDLPLHPDLYLGTQFQLRDIP